MRTIELKTIEVDGQPKLDYRLNIRTALITPVSQQGIDYDEMAKVLPIVAKVDEAKKVLLLEDAEHEILVERIKKAKYSVADERIFQMLNDIIDAPKTDVKAA